MRLFSHMQDCSHTNFPSTFNFISVQSFPNKSINNHFKSKKITSQRPKKDQKFRNIPFLLFSPPLLVILFPTTQLHLKLPLYPTTHSTIQRKDQPPIASSNPAPPANVNSSQPLLDIIAFLANIPIKLSPLVLWNSNPHRRSFDQPQQSNQAETPISLTKSTSNSQWWPTLKLAKSHWPRPPCATTYQSNATTPTNNQSRRPWLPTKSPPAQPKISSHRPSLPSSAQS